MTFARTTELVTVFVNSNVGWWINTDTDERIAQVVKECAAIDGELANRFPRLFPKNRNSLVERLVDDAAALKPLIQTFASPMSSSYRAMVLCVIEGANVLSMTVDYRYAQRSRIVVEVEFHGTGESSSFSSDDLWDFEVLRHFGLMKMSGRPAIDGYYAFRKEAPS